MELLGQCKVDLLKLFLSDTEMDWEDKDVLRILKKRNYNRLMSLKQEV